MERKSGRPKLYENAHPLTVQMERATYKALKQILPEKGDIGREMVRLITEKYLENEKK